MIFNFETNFTNVDVRDKLHRPGSLLVDLYLASTLDRHYDSICYPSYEAVSYTNRLRQQHQQRGLSLSMPDLERHV